MSKAVMISIHPYWCEKIASGQKTIEIRKTRPKIETPFKCYIYCTQDNKNDLIIKNHKGYLFGKISNRAKKNLTESWIANGQVIGEFVCDEVLSDIIIKRSVDDFSMTPQAERALNQSCLNKYAMYEYLSERSGYGLHISDLVIYNNPKELSEFKGRKLVWRGNNHIHDYETMIRPPQSWCYVMEL